MTAGELIAHLSILDPDRILEVGCSLEQNPASSSISERSRSCRRAQANLVVAAVIDHDQLRFLNQPTFPEG